MEQQSRIRPGPKPKYKTEEERRTARLAQQKKWRETSPRYKELKQRDDRKYAQTETGAQTRKAARDKHRGSDSYRASIDKYAGSEKDKATRKRYHQTSKGKSATRQATARRRILIEAQTIQHYFKTELTEIYANTPEGYEVDHIHPLKHELLCGLHVPWNLQYLPKINNRRKSNKLLEGIDYGTQDGDNRRGS